jgi:hypothetical protein
VIAASALFTVFRCHPGRRPLVDRFHIVALTAVLAAILPLAGATLPDPVWVGGFYDDGDYDALLAVSRGEWLAAPWVLILRPLPLDLTGRVLNPVRCALGAPWACLTRSPPPL